MAKVIPRGKVHNTYPAVNIGVVRRDHGDSASMGRISQTVFKIFEPKLELPRMLVSSYGAFGECATRPNADMQRYRR